jgi:hypothetical protein
MSSKITLIVSLTAEIPRDIEPKVLQQLSLWTMKQWSKSRIHSGPDGKNYFVAGVEMATLIKTPGDSPNILFCHPKLAGELKETGLNFRELAKNK